MSKRKRVDEPSHKIENKSLMMKMQQLKFSNAAGKHLDKRTRRARTRSASMLKSLKDFD